MRIDIHDQQDPPLPGENGITILPGYQTDISLSEIITSRLPKPFEDECISYNSMQSQSMCLGVCLQNYNYAKCGCVEPLFPEIEHRKLCNITKVSDVCCLDSVLVDLTQGADCNCPLPCLSTHFSKQISMAVWPSQKSFFKGNQNASFEDLKLYRASHAKVRIYYKTFERKIFDQKPMFHPSELFSYLGGECALWLGLSLTAFFELVELLLPRKYHNL
ncbi:FMRFamide-activated amiloride-sensitive sodium channel [Caerostris extrusa]|uniref:FMRFamide-activated amiloride-sensitive sodium channel n=1 Tax=Caerostris extrusa TaxID=172846 RepID=A0AAV4N168_CAEEX|nr:FMRFamide-activated amiloride-sensitive sodium channel [Caerostris extrusa]